MSTAADEELSLVRDREAVAQIDAVPRMLEVICRTTGLGFSAVARVTSTRWIACAVRDEIAFGLVPGGKLPVATTICNEIREHGRLVVIDDTTADDVFKRHPTPALYGFRSYISVPIVLQNGRFFGTLCAIDPAPSRVSSPQTIHMFRLFAELIAFHLDARDRVIDLETRVAERTSALRGLTGQLERIREDERTRIARELHDDLGQGLTALKLDIEAALRGLDSKRASSALTRDALGSMAAMVDTTLDSVERIVTELRPAVLDTLGISAAAEWLVGRFAKRTGIAATCYCEEAAVSNAAATTLFRVLQEALTNVVRHAGASEVSVAVAHDGRDVVLTVTDNGRGIPAALSRLTDGFGLRGMEERLRLLDGSLTVSAAETGGTILVARCPAITGA